MRRILPRNGTAWVAGLLAALSALASTLFSYDGASAAVSTNDPLFSSQWALSTIGATGAWETTTGSQSVKVAIIDTGILSTLPDFQGQLTPGYNAITPGASTDDDYGSYGAGTRAASVVGARTNNALDMAGVAWNVSLVPVKVCNAVGTCLPADLAEGITWAVNDGADIIQINVTLVQANAAVDAAVADAVNRGVLVVAMAGNVTTAIQYPAMLPGVIAVGATDSNDAVASFSARGPQLDITAPGVGIVTLVRAGCCLSGSGTNLAAAHVSGALALLIAAGVPPSQAVTHLLQSADDLGAPGWDPNYGEGRLDVCDAFVRAGIPCGVSDPCPDVTGDGWLDLQDVLVVLDHFGEIGGGVYDVNGDGYVDLNDALQLLVCPW